MRSHGTVLTVTAALALLQPIAAPAPAEAGQDPPPLYARALDLGTLGGHYSVATAVNADSVAGFSETASGQIHGFWWHHGRMHDLGEIGEQVMTGGMIEDMNERGDIVGADGIHGRAMLWRQGRATDISPPGSVRARALAVNARGHAVGWYRLEPDLSRPSFVFRPFLWDGTHSIPLGGEADTNVVARDLNDRDQVVLVDDSRGTVERWEDGGRVVVGGDWERNIGSAHQSINDRGDVIATQESGSELLPFLWNGSRTGYLVQPGTGGRLAALAVNDRGDVIGSDGLTGAFWRDGQQFAIDGILSCLNDAGTVAGRRWIGDRVDVPFVWQDGKIVELPVAVQADLQHATPLVSDINDRGDVVGSSYVRPGELHATLWPRTAQRPGDRTS